MSAIRNVTVLPDAAALAAAVAAHTVAALRAALEHRDPVHMVLAGGSTPRAVNALLAAEPLRYEVDWTRVVFWFGDERCVPPTDPESNYRMNRETLLDPLGIAADRVHRMRGEDDPSAAAADYEAVLEQMLGPRPRLDIIHLGMGPDGHTASLFPGTVAGLEKTDICVAHYIPKLDRWRITLTPSTINAARVVTIVAAGAEKADALNAVLNGKKQPDVYPAQTVNPRNGELHWFVDAAAASKL